MPEKCSDANYILKKFLERRKKAVEAEEKILSTLLTEETKSCIPIVAKQISEIFDVDFSKVVRDAIETQIEAERPHEWIPPSVPGGEMKGRVEVMKSSSDMTKLEELTKKATDKIKEVYPREPKMQDLWMGRVSRARKEALDKIMRLRK